MSTVRAGVIGLGMIGGGVSVCLARAGRPLAVYDVRPEATEGLEGVPVSLASPAEVARASDVLMIAVVDAKQAREVLSGPNGVLAAAHPGLTVVLLSTVALSELQELDAVCRAAGVALVDCGVTGGALAAQNGLVCLVGGEAAVVERIRPALDDFAKTVLHCGPFGAGMAAKVARNVIPYTIWLAVYESALLAERAGVDLAVLAQAIEESGFPPGITTHWLSRGTVAPIDDPTPDEKRRLEHVGVLLRKDLSAARELADQLGVDLPLANLTRENGDLIFGLEPSR